MRRPAILHLLLLVTAITLASLRAHAQSEPPPVLNQSIPTQILPVASSAQTVTLSSFITNPTVPGTAVRISVILGNEGTGNIDVALTDQQTPLTVANFLGYINAGAYANNIVHRSVPGFVIQDGGYFLTSTDQLGFVPTFAEVQNEPGISNVRGTIAMAKVSGNPNSATSEWFINLADNSGGLPSLDSANGGFTVFGNVIGNTMTVADAIAAVPTYDESAVLTADFTNMPLTSVPPPILIASLIQTSIAVIPGTTFTASSANGSLVTLTVSSNSLQLTPSAVNLGSTTVTVTASALDGGTLTTSFVVTVGSSPSFSLNPFASSVVAGQGTAFFIAAAGFPTPTLQWQSAPAGSGTFTNLTNGGAFAGVTTATLSVTNTTVAISGMQFRCVAGNSVATGVTSGPATLTVTPAPATVTLSSLTANYTGVPLPVTVTTNPSGLAVTVTYSGNTTTAPTNAGTYPVSAVVTDPNHTGSTSGTLVIAPAPATVTLSSLAPTYTGVPLPVTVTTGPAGLAVTVTYSGTTTTAPTNAGTYPVSVVVTDINHTGSVSGTLVIAPAPATLTFSNLAQAYTGSPLPVTVTTNPTALSVSVLYNGSPTPPVGVGIYPVAATISDPNHTGMAGGTLSILPDYASYLAQHFAGAQLTNPVVTGPTANPAGDGMPNLLKYAFGLDPTQSDATAGLPGVGSAGGALTLTYIQRIDISDITYVVEVSSDLQTWSSGPTFAQQISSTPLDATRNEVTVEALPVSGATARFIRLKVTQP